jgi:hypothetical protein
MIAMNMMCLVKESLISNLKHDAVKDVSIWQQRLRNSNDIGK